MKRALALACLLLASCEEKTWTRDEIVDIADDSAPEDNSAQVAELEDRVAAIEERLEIQSKYVNAVHELAAGTSDQVVQNAEVANDNAVRDMTRRGACGKEWIAIEGGGQYLRNIECTKADLEK